VVGQLDPATFPVLTLLGDLEPMTSLNDDTFANGLELIIEGIGSLVRSRAANS